MSEFDEDPEELEDPPEVDADDDPGVLRRRRFWLSLGVGVALGAVVGVVTGDLELWLSAGFALGFAIGAIER